jgi:hypothetical protein
VASIQIAQKQNGTFNSIAYSFNDMEFAAFLQFVLLCANTALFVLAKVWVFLNFDSSVGFWCLAWVKILGRKMCRKH